GDRVGLLVEPSAALPVGLLAVLQCGAAYVPIDPRTPAARASTMLAQAGCAVVLVHEQTRAAAATLGPVPVSIETGPDIADVGHPPPADVVAAAGVAYVIFTSGSTGRPKAVAVSHANALTLAAAAASVYGLTPADRVLQMASPAVDVSVEEFFGAWHAGAAVVMHDPAREELADVVASRRPTVLNLPASRWHEWTADLVARGQSVPSWVRLVIAGSERVDPSRVRAWQTGPGRGVRLLNAYGTTEATVSSVWYDTAHLARDAAYTRNVPIGGPLPHVRCHVLDSAGDPVRAGVAGELYLGGPGVGLGYLGDRQATAQSFLPDPYAAEPGARMYRTGDRVRRLATGELDFLGRFDTQVKVRGSRIDLGEVERAGAEVTGVAQFVADVRDDENGVARLIGYLVPAADAAQGLAEDRVEQWRLVHDEDGYHDVVGAADFNTSGWLSSYTREAIAEHEMREWLEATVARIGEHPARSVLEIGCGTGMILFRVAPGVTRYLGTDLAAGALAYVGGNLAAAGLDDGRVELVEAAADDFTAIGDERFDLIIINSVAQYFPDLAYLERVLGQAWQRLRPGGRIFLGDVRDVTTLAAFHLSVRRSRPGADQDPATLATEVAELVETDNELCVAPAWFAGFARSLPDALAISEVKRGRADTEMNRFRYDVSLWRQPRTTPVEQPVRHDGPVTEAGYATLLDGLRGKALLLTGVPDARSHAEVRLVAGLSPPNPAHLVLPDDLIEAAAVRGYAARVSPAGSGLLTVLVSAPAPGIATAPDDGAADAHTGVAANQPLRAARDRTLIARVREQLTRTLPAAMIPTRFVIVDQVPLTVSGKVDRPRLPAPARSLGGAGRVEANTDTQRALCGIWAQALGLSNVGIRDNFFEVGGDSISWLQIMSRSARAGYRFGARDIFDHQTIEQLAQVLDERGSLPAAATPARPRGADSAGPTPIQRWFFDTFTDGRHHQNQCQWYELSARCATETVNRAVNRVVTHHDGLLTRFTGGPEGVRQHRAAEDTARLPVREVGLTGLPPAERDAVLRAESDRAQSSMHITDGPLYAVVLFRTDDGEPDLVFWCAHHLVVDAVSWRYLTEDLDAALEALTGGAEPVLPAAGADTLAWARWSQEEAGRLSDDELAYWRSTASAAPFALPERHPQASPLARDGHLVSRVLQLATRVEQSGEAFLATCLSAARPVLADATRVDAGTVWLEFHGRPLDPDAPDVTRTVGWFTALFPFLLTAEPGGVRGRLNAVPHGGSGYGRARYLRGEPLNPGANVVVNYLPPGAAAHGRMLRAAPHYAAVTGPVAAPESVMPFAAELHMGLDAGGALTVAAQLGARYFDPAEAEAFIERLAASVAAAFGTAAPEAGEDRFELLPDAVRTSDFVTELRGRPDVTAAYALAPVQRTMLYRHLIDPADDVNYNEFVLELTGDLDPVAFAHAWRSLAQRHEVLRTSFVWTGTPEPIQLVHRTAPEIAVHDLSGYPDAPQRLDRLRARDRAAPPALHGAPPFRLTLATLAPGEHRLVWLDHHILLDGWSSGILVGELMSAYADVIAGRAPLSTLPPPVRYRDYLRWLRQRSTAAASAYWREAFAGFSGPTRLPLDGPPPVSPPSAHDFHDVELLLDSELRTGLHELAERSHTTLGSLYYAAWAAFLQRQAADARVVFGVAQSGRPAPLGDVDTMVGMYMSTLPMVVPVEPTQTVASLVAAVSEQGWQLMSVAGAGSLWDVYDWADVPVSRALFHSVVVVQKFARTAVEQKFAPTTVEQKFAPTTVEQKFARTPVEQTRLPLRARLTPTRTATGFPLTLVVDPDGGALRIVGDRRCLSPDTSRQVLDAFAALLRHTVAAPD
ncbi:amino acid adenylation domain-containing protein, partial [Micromonospora sonneratiae]